MLIPSVASGWGWGGGEEGWRGSCRRDTDSTCVVIALSVCRVKDKQEAGGYAEDLVERSCALCR